MAHFLVETSGKFLHIRAVEPKHDGSNSDAVSPLHQSADDIVGNFKRELSEGLSDVRKFLYSVSDEATKPKEFLTLYRIECEFGGPEEGGWHYDWLEPIATVLDDGVTPQAEVLKAYRETHNARFMGDTYGDRWHVPSHRSTSHYRATHVVLRERVPFSNASHTVPHYE